LAALSFRRIFGFLHLGGFGHEKGSSRAGWQRVGLESPFFPKGI
jgi:hypothetical protein